MGEGRDREHDPDGESRMGPESATGAREQPLEDRVPSVEVERFQDGRPRIAEAAGQLEREDAVLVDDGVDVHIADVLSVAQDFPEAPERRREEAFRSPVRD